MFLEHLRLQSNPSYKGIMATSMRWQLYYISSKKDFMVKMLFWQLWLELLNSNLVALQLQLQSQLQGLLCKIGKNIATPIGELVNIWSELEDSDHSINRYLLDLSKLVRTKIPPATSSTSDHAELELMLATRMFFICNTQNKNNFIQDYR